MLVYSSSPHTHTPTQKLKTLRHPRIVKFQWHQEEGNTTSIITEPVSPLLRDLESMDADEVCLGLYDVLEALVFLNGPVSSFLSNVCLEAKLWAV